MSNVIMSWIVPRFVGLVIWNQKKRRKLKKNRSLALNALNALNIELFENTETCKQYQQVLQYVPGSCGKQQKGKLLLWRYVAHKILQNKFVVQRTVLAVSIHLVGWKIRLDWIYLSKIFENFRNIIKNIFLEIIFFP